MEEYKLTKGRVLKIERDDDLHESPREWDNLGTMMCWHPNYQLGDNSKIGAEWSVDAFCYGRNSAEDFHATLAGFVPDNYFYDADEVYQRKRTWYAKKADKDFIILPLYLYDHSGITMNTTGFSCRWDSGQVGWIYVSKKRASEELGIKRWTKKQLRRVEDLLRAEVETFDQYLTGEVYGFTIEDKKGEHEDSCWGFYGDNHWSSGLLTHALLWGEAKKVAKEIGGETAKSAAKARRRLKCI